MAVAPGTPLVGVITLVTIDDFAPVAGARVHLQRFDAGIGDFRTIQSGVTDAAGQSRVPFTAPTTPGPSRHRASWDGTSTIRADRSPEVRVEIA